MAVSADSVLCIGTTIDQSQYDNVTSDTPHNIYLTITPVSDFSKEATSVKYLTNYTGNGKSFMGVKITPITENRFMISWEEYENTDDSSSENYASADDSLSSSTLHYLFVDGKGNVLSREYTTAAPVSDCQPVVKDSKVVYYASNANTVNFYSIDANDGTASKRFTVLQVKMLPGILQMVFSPFPVRVHLISPRMKTIVSPFLPLRAATVSGAARHGSP